MTIETIQAIAKFLREVPVARKPLSVVWHAGEPLTVPITFYERAFQSFDEDIKPTPLQHNFQTNGTLIDDAWCAFFTQWSVKVGVSIDGPKFIHDAHRVDRVGRGTFGKVMHGLSKLREHNIAFSVLAVLTSESLNAADEMWEFFKTVGTKRIAFNVEEIDGIHKRSSLEDRHLGSFKRFLSRIAKLQSLEPEISVRELDKMRGHLLAPPGAEVYRSDNRPGSILNIDIHGNLTTFSPELLGMEHPRYGKFSWGNVHANSYAEILADPRFQLACADIAGGVDLCRKSCSYFPLCGGGSPSNKLAEHGAFSVSETRYCRFHMQIVADVVMESIEKEMGLDQS